jgi:hypothetical protein
MRYKLRFHEIADRSPGTNRDDRGYAIDAVRLGDGKLLRFTAVLAEETRLGLIGRGGLEGAISEDDQVADALLAFAVRRLGKALRSGSLPQTMGDACSEAVRYDVKSDDFPEIFSGVLAKKCSYRKRSGPDFYCLAPRGGGTPIIPPICRECPVPDSRWICSHLAHASVGISYGADGEPVMSSPRAMCNKGRPEVQDFENCRPGQNSCWERVVESEEARSSRHFAPEALPEALDFLDATWRLAFGRKYRLLNLRSAADTATLVADCTTRKDLVACISALDDVLKCMRIADELLADADRTAEETKGDRTLNRLAACIRNKIAEPGLSQAGIEAVDVLRNANKIRVALQHSARSEELTKALAVFDLSPTDEWSQVWTAVRARVTEALIDLRKTFASPADSE